MAKLNNKMITLCSAAVGAIYLAGYSATEQTTDMAIPHQAQEIQNLDQGGRNVKQQKQSKNMPEHKAVIYQPKIYKNGTFYGTGTTRIGSVEVAVTTKHDKITSVEITKCDTHYSQSKIDGLPEQALKRQSSRVDLVSGATLSSEDFQWAVEEALQQAKI
ncbi:FMN-binding protein [Peribacillus sp. B-H-3]|uniref:FMN-binding protein n=1 Tax=Peribacillus sp. B-H-3 TaxID=3400420 RepID=UPI003B011EE8